MSNPTSSTIHSPSQVLTFPFPPKQGLTSPSKREPLLVLQEESRRGGVRGAWGDNGGCFRLCLQSRVFSSGGDRMGTVPGSPPESYRLLAGTMGSSTWHPPPPSPEHWLCFLEPGWDVFVPAPTAAGPGRLLAHLQAGGPHAASHAGASAGQASAPFSSGRRCFLRLECEPAPPWRPAPGAGSGELPSGPAAVAPKARELHLPGVWAWATLGFPATSPCSERG